MASRSSRQRKLERARAERRLARQAQRARRKRQTQAGIGAALALILIVLGTTWLLGGFDSKPQEAAAPPSCTWVPKDAATNPDIIDSGTPPASGELRSGFETMSIKTNLGDIEAVIDLSKAPCAAASFKYLGDKGFFASSKCHRLNVDAKTLTCGDPKSTGVGGPSYQFADENLPTAPIPAATTDAASPAPTATTPASYYAKGSIVMVNTGANTNGSQFSIVYGDGSNLTAAYTLVGTITKGLDLIENAVKAGAVDAAGKPTSEGKPVTDVTIQQLTIVSPTDPTAAPTDSATPSTPPTGQS